jgi:hypothetical protein
MRTKASLKHKHQVITNASTATNCIDGRLYDTSKRIPIHASSPLTRTSSVESMPMSLRSHKRAGLRSFRVHHVYYENETRHVKTKHLVPLRIDKTKLAASHRDGRLMERDFRKPHFLQLTIRKALVFEGFHLDLFPFDGLGGRMTAERVRAPGVRRKNINSNIAHHVPSLLESFQRSAAKG